MILLEKHQIYGYHGLLAVNVLDDLKHNRILFSIADKNNRNKEYQTNKFYKYYLSLQNGKYNSHYVQRENFDAILNINLLKVRDYNPGKYEIGPVQYPEEKYESEERIIVKSKNISELKPMNKYVESIHIFVDSDIDRLYYTTVQLYKGLIEEASKLNIPLYFYDKVLNFKTQHNGINGDRLKEFYKLLERREDEILNSIELSEKIIKKQPLLKEGFYKNNLIRKEYPYLSTLTYMLSLATENYVPTKFFIYESKEIDNNIKNIIKNVYKKKGWIIEYNIKLKKEMEYNNFPYGFEMYDLYSKLNDKYTSNHNMLFELSYLIKEVLKNKRLTS